jgi:hypothetical protein
MANISVFLTVLEKGARTRLTRAWVYWKENGQFQVLRADAGGSVQQLASGGDATQPASYTTAFTTSDGASVGVYFSQGAKPLPQSLVEPILRPVVVTQASGSALSALGPVQLSPTVPNAMRRVPLAQVDVDPNHITLTSPGDEPALLPVFWESLEDENDAYYLDGLVQGSTIFSGNPLRENSPAPAPASAVRPRPRGIEIAGTVPAAATSATLQLLDASGKAISLLQDGSSLTGAVAPQLTLTLGAASGPERPFTGTVFLPNNTTFGAVQLVIQPQGVTPAQVAGFFFLLAGVQLGVVDDAATNQNGKSPGPQTSVNDDVVVVDYTDSPQSVPGTTPADRGRARALEQAVARQRRLTRFPIQCVQRPLATPATQSLICQMPLLMAELQLLGADRTALEDLLRHRQQGTQAVDTLRLDLNWSLKIDWPTPDTNNTNPPNSTPPFIQPQLAIGDQQTVSFKLDTNASVSQRRLQGISGGKLPSAFSTPPTALTFPEAGRRTPTVLISDAGAATSRAWDRHGVPTQPCLAVEWQPNFTATRGGNAQLSLDTLSIDGAPAPPGVEFPRPPQTATTPTRHPTSSPLAMLPRFRLFGINPPTADVNALVDLQTQTTIAANATLTHLAFLSVGEWQAVMRAIVTHETGGRQYQIRSGPQAIVLGPAGAQRTYSYAREQDMPIFGGPHGYGIGQLDPPSNAQEIWNFQAAVQACVNRMLIAKAGGAQSALNLSGLTRATISVRQRNMFVREAVRRYNGGTEFRFDATAGDFVIKPRAPQARFTYPNQVLGSSVAYQDLLPNPTTRAPAIASQLTYTSADFTLGP